MRFSLRTLLLLVTLAACACGMHRLRQSVHAVQFSYSRIYGAELDVTWAGDAPSWRVKVRDWKVITSESSTILR